MNVYVCQRCRRAPKRFPARWLCRQCGRWICEHLAGFKKVEDRTSTCTRCLCLAEQARQAKRPKL